MLEVRREGEALCRVSQSTMGQLLVTDCKERQDTGYRIQVTGYMWGVRMTMMYIRTKQKQGGYGKREKSKASDS